MTASSITYAQRRVVLASDVRSNGLGLRRDTVAEENKSTGKSELLVRLFPRCCTWTPFQSDKLQNQL